MLPLTAAAILNLQNGLASTSPITLLLIAEAGGVAAQNNFAGGPSPYQAAAAAVAAAMGYPLSSYSENDQNTIVAVVGSFLQGLNYLTQGPSLQYPQGNYYQFNF